MKKLQHDLSDNKTTRIPKHIIFFDTETNYTEQNNQMIHTLRLGVMAYLDTSTGKVTWTNFATIEQFWAQVLSIYECADRRKVYLVAHNIMFDAGVVELFGELEKRGFEYRKGVFDYARQIWWFKKGAKQLICLDNMNWFKGKLETLGLSIGIPKLTMPAMTDDDHEWFVYCRRDVDILVALWQQWFAYIEEHDLGNWGMTISAQAFNAFRHRFMKSPVRIHNNQRAITLERLSYRGGRSEAFYQGKLPADKYYMLDVNSMYPYIMKMNSFPCNLLGYSDYLSVNRLSELLKDYAVTATVDITTPEAVFGVKHLKRLVFPIGSYRVTLASAELQYALDRHYINTVHEVSVYERAKIFTEYVDFFYQQRQEFKAMGNKSYQQMSKEMLNHLYGKLGQSMKIWKKVGHDPELQYGTWVEINPSGTVATNYRCINHQVEQQSSYRVEGFDAFVAIASEVTGYARMYLWSLMVTAGLKNVKYVDTDSLIVNQAGYDKLKAAALIDQAELGKLKVEMVSENFTIHNVKRYQLGKRIKRAGVRASAVDLGDDQYQQWQSVNMPQGLRRGTVNRTIWQQVIKRLSSNYNKGIVLSTGQIVPVIMAGEQFIYADIDAMIESHGSTAIYAGHSLQYYAGGYGVVREVMSIDERDDAAWTLDRMDRKADWNRKQSLFPQLQ